MNKERLEELAALNAAGALEGPELSELEQFLAAGDRDAQATVAQYGDLMTLVALAQSGDVEPPSGLKARVLKAIRPAAPTDGGMPLVEAAATGLKYVFAQEENGWQKLPVPGAYVKLLSLDPARGFAVVLGKLDAGARYPAHRHQHSEQIYVLSGDLHIGSQRLGAGDFHHADAGSVHGINHSEAGCTILAVLSTADLQAQLALA